MAPRKRKSKGMLTGSIPDDVVEHIFSYLTIKEAVQNSVLSSRFKNSWRLSRIIDFGPQFANNHEQLHAVDIINKAFDGHRAPQIERFIVDINPRRIMLVIEKWIRRCVDRDVEELQIDFARGGDYTLAPPFDLSTIETLKFLKLRFCEFQTPNTMKGLKFLNTLVLKQTQVSTETMRSVFQNCFNLKNVELIECLGIQCLTIGGKMLTKFESLSVVRCPDLRFVLMEAPFLKAFRYSGMVCVFKFRDIHSLKDVVLDFEKREDLFGPLLMKLIVLQFNHMTVLSTTSVFLEGMTKRIEEGEFKEIDCKFENLEEFQIFMKHPSYCNLFDIANFLKNCPSLRRFYLDINNFTFDCGFYWIAHQMHLMKDIPTYNLDSLKFVQIKGFKGHRHELDIVKFFLEKATWLETLVLVTPKKDRTRMYYPSDDTISALNELSPNATIRVFEDFYYKSPIPPKHGRKLF